MEWAITEDFHQLKSNNYVNKLLQYNMPYIVRYMVFHLGISNIKIYNQIIIKKVLDIV